MKVNPLNYLVSCVLHIMRMSLILNGICQIFEGGIPITRPMESFIGDNIAEGSRKGWCEIAVSNWIWIGTRKYFWHVEGRNIRMLNYWNTSMANWLSNSDLPPWLGRRRRGNNPAIVFPSAELDFVIMHFLCCAKCEFSRLYTLGISLGVSFIDDNWRSWKLQLIDGSLFKSFCNKI